MDLSFEIQGEKGTLYFNNENMNEMFFYNKNSNINKAGYIKLYPTYKDNYQKFFNPLDGFNLGFNDQKLIEVNEMLKCFNNKKNLTSMSILPIKYQKLQMQLKNHILKKLGKNMKFLNNSDKKTYIKKNFKQKEVYKQIEKIIKNQKRKKKILDVGTANGELIYFLNKKFKNKFDYTGIDISSKLIDFAKKNQPNIRFLKKNINDSSFKEKFDIIILLGISGYYSDLRKLIDRSLFLLNKNGIIILEGGVNFNNFDVEIKFRQNSEKIKSKWEKGFNAISVYSLTKYLKKRMLVISFLIGNSIFL